MGERIEVDRLVDLAERVGTRFALDDLGRTEVRGLGDARGELRGELAEAEMLTAVADEVERCSVPEARGAAVAEQDLVAVGQVEQRRQPVADLADLVAHGRLAVRRAQVRRGVGEQGAQLLGADLRGAGAEASVARQEVGGDLEGLG